MHNTRHLCTQVSQFTKALYVLRINRFFPAVGALMEKRLHLCAHPGFCGSECITLSCDCKKQTMLGRLHCNGTPASMYQ